MRFLDTIGTPKGAKFLLKQFQRHLPRGMNVLELDTPGQDNTVSLDSWYRVYKPDSASATVHYEKSHLPYLQPSFTPFNNYRVEGPFDGIFCNKVLHYYSPEDVPEILKLVKSWLKPSGLVLFSLMNKAKEEQPDGIPVYYYDTELLKGLMEPSFKILELESYSEIRRKDSLYVLARL